MSDILVHVAEAKASGAIKNAKSVVMNLSVGSPATTEIAYVPEGVKDVQKFTSEVTSKEMQRLQKLTLTYRDSPDVKASITAVDSEVEFEGYVTAPILRTGHGSSTHRVSCAGYDSPVANIRLQAYSPKVETYTESATGKVARILEYIPGYAGTETGDVAEMIRSCLDSILESYEYSLSIVTEESAKATLPKIHEVNQKALPFLHAVLDNTSVEIPNWDKVVKQNPFARISMADMIVSSLQAPSQNFWNNLYNIAEELRLLYVPSLDGPGKFIRSDDAYVGDAEDLNVHGTGVSKGTGGSFTTPITGVIVLGAATNSDHESLGEGFTLFDNVYGSFPEDMEPGRVVEVQVPRWLRNSKGQYAMTSFMSKEEASADADSGGKKYSPSDYLQRRKKLHEKAKKAAEEGAKVMDSYAETVYHEKRLEPSTVTVQTILVEGPEIGKRYAVTDSNGLKFEGFLHTKMISMSRENGSTSAGTTLRFSHVEY